MENIEEPIEDNVEIEEVKEVSEEPMQKPKVKKPRTEKQIEALKKAQEIRRKNVEDKRIAILKEKQEREERVKEIKDDLQNDADDESEEEIQSPVKKPKAKPKRKVKKAPKVVFEDSESDEEQEIVIRKVRRNKKQLSPETIKPSSPINIPQPVEKEENIEPIVEQRKYTQTEILRAMGL